MKDKKMFTQLWKRAKKYTEESNNEKALPLLEKMIIHLSKLTLSGEKILEGLKIDLWKERAWLSIETLGVLPEYKEGENRQLGSIINH